MSLLHLARQTPLTRRLIVAIASGRAKESVGHFSALLSPHESILDIGAGLCDISALLAEQGHAVTALDVSDFSCMPTITPVVYDGTRMPFADASFDTALLLTVLHHTSDPDAVLREAARVARRVIITEDIYTSRMHRWATYAMDSLLNLEFFGHPHSNRTDAAWRETFERLGLCMVRTRYMRSFGVMRHRLYVLEPLAVPGAAKPEAGQKA